MVKDRETIVVDCNSQYGRCEVVNKLKLALNEIEKELIPICESCRKYYYNQHC